MVVSVSSSNYMLAMSCGFIGLVVAVATVVHINAHMYMLTHAHTHTHIYFFFIVVQLNFRNLCIVSSR